MVRDVALRLADRIVLLEEAQPALHPVRPAQHRRRLEGRDVASQQVEQILGVAAVFDPQLALRISFAQCHPRPQGEPNSRPPAVNPDGHRRTWTDAPNAMGPTGLVDDGQLAFAHYAGKKPN